MLKEAKQALIYWSGVVHENSHLNTYLTVWQKQGLKTDDQCENWYSEFTILIQDLQALSTAGPLSASSQAVKKGETIVILI